MPNRRIENITAKITGASAAETFDVYDDVAIHKYDTVASMVADTNLKVDEVCKTAGYNSKNDGGASLYVITSTADSSKYTIALSNGSYATMIREDVIVPEQFGAYGNGTNDDTNALKKCFAMGGNIHLPKGKTYAFSSYIPVVSNSIIRFDATLSATAVADTSLEFYDRVNGAAGYSGVHDVVIYGEGVIDMHGDTMSDGYASTLRIHHCTNIRVEGLTIKNYSKYHAIESGGTDGLILDGMKFLGCYPNGDTGDHEAIQIETTTEGGTSGAIPYDNTPTKNVTIKNCLFTSSEEGGLAFCAIGTHQKLNDPDWATYFSNITIENNTFIGANRAAISFDSNFRNVKIINNEFRDNNQQRPAIYLENYMDNIVISGNTFRNLSYEVLRLGTDTAPTADSKNILSKVSFCNNFIDGYNLLGTTYCTGVSICAITSDMSVMNNVFKFDTTNANRPVFLSGNYRSEAYAKNLLVENNIYNGRIVSKHDRYFYYGGAANTVSEFLQNRLQYFMNNVTFVTPTIGDVGSDTRNVYFIAGAKDGTADMLSIVYYNAISSRATMITIPQVPNYPKLIVTSYSGGTYSHYQIALTAFTV